QGAVERAFAAGSAAAPTVAPSRRQVVRAPGKRRAGSELSALGERFLEVLIQRPGETMVVLSAEIGATPRELHRAVARLRAGGRAGGAGAGQGRRGVGAVGAGRAVLGGADPGAGRNEGGGLGGDRGNASRAAPGGGAFGGGRAGADRRRALSDAVLPAFGGR